MARYGMIIDTKRCVGCQACVVACTTENRVPSGFQRGWVETVTQGEIPNLRMQIFSERCSHCSNPPCVSCCPTGASHVEEGGFVLVDRGKCTGCKACIAACPSGSRYLHPEGFADKCTFCDHRARKGLDPACVATCPTRSMHFTDLDNPDARSEQLLNARKSVRLQTGAGTEPNIYFLE